MREMFRMDDWPEMLSKSGVKAWIFEMSMGQWHSATKLEQLEGGPERHQEEEQVRGNREELPKEEHFVEGERCWWAGSPAAGCRLWKLGPAMAQWKRMQVHPESRVSPATLVINGLDQKLATEDI